MSSYIKKHSFFLLNTIQFLDALNENLFKLIVVYFLIFYEGIQNTSLIMSITGAIFLLPFVLFSSLGGIVADCQSKPKVILITRIIQLFIFFIAWIGVVFISTKLIYITLFLVASISAVFGPSKYGMIPEIVPSRSFLKANSLIAAFTFFAIILGTSFASLLDTLVHQMFPLMFSACIVFSLTGTVLSFFLPSLPIANPKKKWSFFIYKELWVSCMEMHRTPLLLTAVIAYAYFLFLGAFVQLNIIPYSVQTLHMSPCIWRLFICLHLNRNRDRGACLI